MRRATSDEPCRRARGHAWEASVVKIVDQSRVACVFPIKHLCKTNQPRESTYYYGCANREATEPYRHKQGTRLPLISCVSTIISRTQSSLSLSHSFHVALLPALPAIPQQSPLSYKPFPHGYEARDALSQPRVTSHHLSDDSRHSGEWRASAHCSTASTRTHPPTLRHPERYNRPPKTEPTGIDHHSP